jgi:acetoin:2,6-dichlorophenolindophenol oxidoreductase subunit alpha
MRLYKPITLHRDRALKGMHRLDDATLIRMLYLLKLTREAELRIEDVLYRQGKIVGGVYTGRGQEAIGVGSAIQLTEGDWVLPSHRDFSSFLLRGFSLRQIIANWMGRANTPTRGRDNTLHLGDLKLGVIPIISPLGDTLPVACGVAMALQRRGQHRVVLVHFGEGTTSRGDVHEAMNMAAVMKLPVVFICNNNGYAYSTPTTQQFLVDKLSVRGPAYGMEGFTVDGNDVLQVYEGVWQAITRARKNDGPTFIECQTFRLTGHSAHDGAEYVPREVMERQAKNDPIPRFELGLLGSRILTHHDVREMEEKIRGEIDDAVAYAESSPEPEGPTAVEGVLCGPDCWWKRPIDRDEEGLAAWSPARELHGADD